MKKIAVIFCTLCLLLSLSPAALAEEDLDLGGSTAEVSQAAEGIQDLDSEAREYLNEESAPPEATEQEPPAQEAPAGGNQSPRGLQTIEGSYSVISSGGNPSPGGLNAMFAQMQQDLANQVNAKDSALGYMEGVQEAQREHSEAANYLDQVRELQIQAAEAEKAGASSPELPEDVKAYLDANGLSYGGGTDLDAAARALQDRQEELSTDIQSQMVQVQDAIGRLNETTFPGMQGLSSTTWGQSLFSTQGGVSTGLPPIAASILIGVLLGMALMGAIQRKRTGGREL